MANGQTVAKQIFKTPWMVQVPTIHRYSNKYIEQFGLPSTGDRQWDRELMESPITVYMTIAEMVMIFGNGGSITFVEPKDAKPVYELLHQHLKNWQLLVEKSLHSLKPPIEDLELMDEFMTAIYPIAARYMNTDLQPTGLAQRLSNMGSGLTQVKQSKGRLANPLESLRRGRKKFNSERTEEEPETEQHELPKNMHQPLADAIARMTFNKDNR